MSAVHDALSEPGQADGGLSVTVMAPDAIVLEVKVPIIDAVPTACPFEMMLAVSENESLVIGSAPVEIRTGWHPVSWYDIEWDVTDEPLTLKARRRP